MEFTKGQVMTGNDGKERQILEVTKNRRGKGPAIHFIELREGKWFGPQRVVYTSKPPKWLI